MIVRHQIFLAATSISQSDDVNPSGSFYKTFNRGAEVIMDGELRSRWVGDVKGGQEMLNLGWMCNSAHNKRSKCITYKT